MTQPPAQPGVGDYWRWKMRGPTEIFINPCVIIDLSRNREVEADHIVTQHNYAIEQTRTEAADNARREALEEAAKKALAKCPYDHKAWPNHSCMWSVFAAELREQA